MSRTEVSILFPFWMTILERGRRSEYSPVLPTRLAKYQPFMVWWKVKMGSIMHKYNRPGWEMKVFLPEDLWQMRGRIMSEVFITKFCGKCYFISTAKSNFWKFENPYNECSLNSINFYKPENSFCNPSFDLFFLPGFLLFLHNQRLLIHTLMGVLLMWNFKFIFERFFLCLRVSKNENLVTLLVFFPSKFAKSIFLTKSVQNFV